MSLHQVALHLAEVIANSWSAVTVGGLRIINYAGSAFAAAATGALIFFSVVGREAALAVLVIAVFVVTTAGLWGQVVEFSGRLARPFGYYGALIGAFLGVGAASILIDISPWLLGAGLALAAPVVQAIGRLRCLVQGCCHGARVCESTRGIVYRRKESRVLRLANLGFEPVHPTPLYSMYSNALILLVLWRLTAAGAMQTHVVAAYLIISGALRFIEEAYRGEPQTPSWQGLKLYQWLAIAQGLAGIALSSITSAAMPMQIPPSTANVLAALLVGLIAGAAMGADFPGSRRRFSQLTPTDP
jgi:prolipoprotein diacylglyceryltransferase